MVSTRSATNVANGTSKPPEKRVKRRKQDNAGVNKENCEAGDEESIGANAAVCQASRKRVKPAAGLGRRKAGKLSKLMTVPMDVFYEICSHLEPSDLLTLARTACTLRKSLMTRSCAYVWKQARETAGIPTGPASLSEPQLADLMFGRGCNLCNDKRARKTYFMFFARLCKKCSEENLADGLALFLPWRSMVNENDKSLIGSLMNGSMADIVHDYEDLSLLYQTFYKPEFDAVMSKFISFKRDSPEFDAFVSDRRFVAADSREKAVALEKWKLDEQTGKQEANLAKTSMRRASIMEKLRALGYGGADFNPRNDLQDWKWKHLLEQPRELTDRVWSNIRPALEETIQLRRERNASIELESNRNQRKLEVQNFFIQVMGSMFSSNDLRARLFRPQDLMVVGTAKDLIERNKCRTSIAFSDCEPIKELLHNLLDEHARTVEQRCVQVLREGLLQLGQNGNNVQPSQVTVEFDIKVLRSAIAFFKHPNHPRGTMPYTFKEILLERLNLPKLTNYSPSVGQAWIDLDLQADLDFIASAKFLLNELGFSEWVSMKHMESKGVSFVCNRCPGANDIKRSWSDMVKHTTILRTTAINGDGHDLSKLPKKAVSLRNRQVVDESVDSDTSGMLFGVVSNLSLAPDPLFDDEGDWDSDSMDGYSGYSDDGFWGILDDGEDYYDEEGYYDDDFYGEDYDSEDEGCVIA